MKEVEVPHLVRAVVRAVPRADAAVVDHVVQALGAVGGGGDGADELARGVLALHARHRLVQCPRVAGIAFPVAVDPDPVQGVPARDLDLADGRDVVLRLASDDARVAAGARVQVDRHAPGVHVRLIRTVESVLGPGRLHHLLRELRVLFVLFERPRPHERPPLHVLVMLRRHELVRPAGLRDLQSRLPPERVRRAERVGVEAGLRAELARPRAAVPQGERRRVVRMARKDPRRGLDRAPAAGEPQDVFAGNPEARRGRGRKEHGVVPRQLRDRLGQLLQPRVVREPPVVDRRIGAEADLDV